MHVTILFSPISGCQFLFTSFCLIWCLLLALVFFFLFFFLSQYLFFSIWRLLKFSLFSQSVALLALSWNKIILNRKALLGAQTGIKDSSFNQNIHKHPQTSCTANVSFLIHVKILAIYFQGRIHIALQLLCMKCSAVREYLSKTEWHLVLSQSLLSSTYFSLQWMYLNKCLKPY